MNFHILTLFPEMVMQTLMTSITGRAVRQNKIGIEAVNIRDYTNDRHHRVDDYPYGGGAGMLMQAQPVYDACESVLKNLSDKKKRVIYVTPQGVPFTQQMAGELAENDDLVFICGHYEGIDERVLEEVVTDYISIGDYVLTGGELAAMVIVDAVSRLIPGVLNNGRSAETESFYGNLLEYPQYSRPETWHGKTVPKVLLSGNQREIAKWQKEAAIRRTKERRPDLYKSYSELMDCKEVLMRQKLNHIDMIELINRGRAVLVWRRLDEILLKDKVSGIYFHANLNPDSRISSFDWTRFADSEPDLTLTIHQEYMADLLQEKYAYQMRMRCRQFAYTRKEKLSVRRLYSENGISEGLYEIRPLGMAYAPLVADIYKTVDDVSYVEERIKKGVILGCFLDGELYGFMGIHNEGSMGMLEILPGYRRKKAATALETYLVNHMLAQGMIPYGQAEEKNDPSLALQEKLGLCLAKNPVFWMKANKSIQ